MKVGLFFGSFNPIHIGHLIIANSMVENTDLEKVWFVVSPQNPFKKRQSLLHEFDRYDMVRAAIYDNYNLDVTDVEFNMPRPSYTVDTLAYLSSQYPDNEFRLIIGEDNLHSFSKWKNYQVILDQYGLYVYPRPGAQASEFADHPHVKMIPAPLLDISATYIRKSVAEGKSIKYLVHPAVEDLILGKKFYI
ncbi:nicotinate (nicotinamide) nucleotide adenylyltransferase [Fulvivirga sedimenti]|uniref:Probable nicotinate-nucleotide adenylyltransferase n=1 Tax=Fulvivirga sedimenti TaxID=2879465 RepID=A0A9X1HL84_9BACT|nr:nicotinate (nicotinamide) nucleotide adenylyltransferase [Fulvivirga sedimenti]MCA6074233.1 nicotinate-nucleotide adenylyltransferase [Fulvivirga sedimenti]